MTDHSESIATSPTELLQRVEQAERELEMVREQLRHTHRLAMVGTLAAGVLHEINNIFTPVLAYAQMLSSNPSDPKLLAKMAEKAARGVQQATEIAESMLDLAQPERQRDVKKRADVAEVCRSAIDCLGRDPAKDRIECTVDVPEGLVAAMQPLALQQVLLNLIINAIEAMKSGPSHDKRLLIRAEQQPGHRIRIRVIDTGPGIPAHIQSNLFAPFVTGNVGLTGGQTPKGRGLGLCVCRTLLEAAGGTIDVENDEPRGTAFVITIPEFVAQSNRKAG